MNFIKKINPILGLLTCLVAHTFFHLINISEALTIAALCSLYGFHLYLESKKKADVSEDFKKELHEIKSTMNSLKLGRVFGK